MERNERERVERAERAERQRQERLAAAGAAREDEMKKPPMPGIEGWEVSKGLGCMVFSEDVVKIYTRILPLVVSHFHPLSFGGRDEAFCILTFSGHIFFRWFWHEGETKTN